MDVKRSIGKSSKDIFAKPLLLSAATLLMAGTSLAVGAPVVDAARTGDVEAVRESISSGGDVNQPERDGTTALLWSAYHADPSIVAMLLEQGADPNAANRFGVTPLLQSARMGDAQTLRTLLDGGATVTVDDSPLESALHAAARAGSVEGVQLLLERGADVDALEPYQDQTALMLATAEGHLDVVDALLNGGADPNLQARVSELTKRSMRTDFPTGGFTALMWAAREGYEDIVRRLVEGGADLNMTNGDGATPMMLAIINDRFDFAAKLLELGADANDGSLYRAVEMRDATTDWLAQDGTRLRRDYDNELTALDLMGLLLDAGADPNKPYTGQMHSASMCCDTFENGSPFFRAAIAADVAALELLVAHGGDLEWSPEKSDEGGGPGANKNIGKTPLMVAMDGGKGVGMAGGPGDIREGTAPPFREEANREPADAVRLLLEAGANPDAVTPEGEAALHIAAKDGKLDIVNLLADAGATLDLTNKDGETALEIVEKMPAREPPPLTGALAGVEQGAQPAEVAALLRELMGLPAEEAQANLTTGSNQ
jgi:ankyrin repeat protein